MLALKAGLKALMILSGVIALSYRVILIIISNHKGIIHNYILSNEHLSAYFIMAPTFIRNIVLFIIKPDFALCVC